MEELERIARDELPERIKTAWGGADYVGAYRSSVEGYLYVYRLHELGGSCRYIEFHDDEMRMLIEREK